ncbi:hypothetical protein ACX27_14775 [Nostoc piscinale CENA21]|uniref:Uncharacterized protein n=1 Tax=Nostoc piscinale CENA21 TaxID=224013 RepID=A0A0M4SWA4_9NOSO|nr:hypothetical protein [Nostoc piscinale]ALF52959.1 hypothetical protein ACX27_09015 [Nostoc piscinale CENA21]ALF52980.1 hypothetical protein ACX27_09155 [Nostoc piscinale CENA21]ALF53826.1 hypothetical protein ACX27_14775 [Nostoc piscinale CENA21]
MTIQTIEIQKIPRIWRIQGDITEGDLNTLVLEIFWRIDWVTLEGTTINNESGGMIKFTTTSELLLNFSTIAEAIYAQINSPEIPLINNPDETSNSS